jgi:hypothetical protein
MTTPGELAFVLRLKRRALFSYDSVIPLLYPAARFDRVQHEHEMGWGLRNELCSKNLPQNYLCPPFLVESIPPLDYI